MRPILQCKQYFIYSVSFRARTLQLSLLITCESVKNIGNCVNVKPVDRNGEKLHTFYSKYKIPHSRSPIVVLWVARNSWIKLDYFYVKIASLLWCISVVHVSTPGLRTPSVDKTRESCGEPMTSTLAHTNQLTLGNEGEVLALSLIQ